MVFRTSAATARHGRMTANMPHKGFSQCAFESAGATRNRYSTHVLRASLRIRTAAQAAGYLCTARRTCRFVVGGETTGRLAALDRRIGESVCQSVAEPPQESSASGCRPGSEPGFGLCLVHRHRRSAQHGNSSMERLPMEACASGRARAAGQDGSGRSQWSLMLLVAAAYAVLLIAGVGIGLNAVTSRQGLGGAEVGEELPVVGRRQLLQEEQGDAVDADGCPVCEILCLTCAQHPEPAEADSCLAAQLCADPLAVGVVDDRRAAQRSAAFRLLDAAEISAVTRFMERSRGFIPSGSRWNLLPLVEQLTAESIPVKGTDDIIVRVETMHPSKAEVLAFLDENGPEPKRHAKVVVVRGTQQDVMEYKVGPVPFAPEVGPAEVSTLRGDGEIPWAKRPAFGEQEAWEEVAVAQAAWQLRALLKELTGGRCYPVKDLASVSVEQVQQSRQECEEGWLGWHSSAAHQPNPAERHAVVSWKFSPGREGGSEAMLHGVPLSFKLNASDADYMQWTTFDFEYCHQGPFTSAVELLQAWEAGELRACAVPGWAGEGYDYDWAVTHQAREPFPGFSSPGPRLYEAGYKRFAVLDGKAPTGNGFRWLHWEGFFLLNPERGLQLFDLRWKGDRIVYELALQEQFSAFSGYASAGMAVRMESAAHLGESAQPLKLGVDCPETATYFPATRQWSPLDVGVERDVICMFEHDLGGSAWRHTQPGGLEGPHIDGVRGTALVIRTISTVGNYNYGYDVIFHLDASIEVKMWMGGYMDTVFFSPDGATEKDSPFGTRVQNHTFAMMHDHLSNWKVDIDVHGTLNSFRKDVVRAGSFAKALRPTARGEGAPGWFSEMRLPLKYVESSAPRREATFLVNASEPTVWRIVNDQVVNAWGAPSGYAVVTRITAHQLLPASHPVAQAAAWSKYNLAITQRKEEEATSTSSCDAVNPGFPVTSLDQYLDGESIEEQDLVAWVTVGEQHLPRTEDLPLFKGRGTSFYIKPWDYFEELQSMNPADTSDFQPFCVPRIGDQYEYGSFYDRVVG